MRGGGARIERVIAASTGRAATAGVERAAVASTEEDTLGRTFRSRSAAETRELGVRLGAQLRGGEVVLLCGDLGAGKTQFAKGVAGGLGVRAEVVSPTFTMAVRYEGRLPLVHYDLYRVRGERELVEMGFLECEDPSEVAVVEWGDRTDAPAGAIRVRIEIEPDGTRRLEVDGIDLAEAS